jgi:multidrug efflux pump
VTVIALVLSWVVSVYFVPYLGTLLLKAKPHVAAARRRAAATHELFDTPFLQHFRRTVNWCVQHRWITIGATCWRCLRWALWAWARCSSSSSPTPAGPKFWWILWLPEGTLFAANEAVAKRVEAR